MAPFVDVYAVLGVPPRASQAELKAAHRRLVRRHHPDLAAPAERPGATRRIQEVNVAYGLVRDPATRASYDRLRRAHRARMTAHGATRTAREGAARWDAATAAQWDAAVRAAGRWAGRWWRRHRARIGRTATAAGRVRSRATRTRRAGVDVLGRLAWLLSSVLWAAVGLATAMASQRLVGVGGYVAPTVGLVAGAVAGSVRGTQLRLRLAGLPHSPVGGRAALGFAAAAVVAGLAVEVAFGR
jgi:hypothetical protein